MRNCYRLLLMLTMLAQTVRCICVCNSDGNSTETFLADTNVYVMHGIICDEIPIAGISCEWNIDAVSASTIIAVEFKATYLDSADTANNRAEFKDDNGVVITSVTSSAVYRLTQTSSPGTAVMVTLNVASGTNIIPMLEFGFIAVTTDNEDCQGKNGETIELQHGSELIISSGNFPSVYDNNLDCTFTVIPKNGGALSLNVVYMLTEDFFCPVADPVTLTFDNESPDTKCGAGFHQLERNNIQSRVVVKFKTDGSVQKPGWLMHFTEKGRCDPNPCQGKKRRNRCKICTRDACDNCKNWWHQSRNRYCKPCCNRHTGKCRKIGKRGKRKCRQFFCST